MKKSVSIFLIIFLALFLIVSFFSIPTSTLFSPSLKNLKPIEIGVFYKYCTTDAQCELNQKCYKNSCRNKICTDSDGGIVPEVFGTVSVSLDGIPSNPIYYSDICANSLNLKEFYCNENNNPSIQEILCPGVCQNGACVTAVCGDGIKSSNEECDGDELGNEDCISQGFDSGTLTCDENCQFDTSQCFNEQDCTNNIPPTAVLPDDISSWPVGKPLSISSQSSDSDGQIVLYAWDFGDGITQETFEPFGFHTYNNTGFFTVSLTVTDNCDATSTDSMQIYSNLTADFFFYPTQIAVRERAYFESYTPIHLVNSYRWSFSDGGVNYGKNISRIFNGAGNKSVTLRIVTKSGQVIYSEPQYIDVIAYPVHRLSMFISPDRNLTESYPRLIPLGNLTWFIGKTLQVYNTSNKSSPQFLDYGIGFDNNNEGIHGVSHSSELGLIAAVSSRKFLYIYNASDTRMLDSQTGNLHYILKWPQTSEIEGNVSGDPQFVGNRLYVKTPSGLTVLSMENLPNIGIVNSFPQLNFGGIDNKLDKTKNLLYSVYGYNVSIFNVTNPDNPTLIWAIDDASYLPASDPEWHSGPTEISISDDLLAIGECAGGLGNGKFSFFNVSNPLNPILLSRTGGVSTAYCFGEFSRGYFFIPNIGTLKKFYIANLYQPQEVDQIHLTVSYGILEKDENEILYYSASAFQYEGGYFVGEIFDPGY